MMTTNIKRNLSILIAGCIMSAVTSCQEHEWDNYYGYGGETGLTLMQAMESDPNLSMFASTVRKSGFDKYLSSSQSFTVFAPDNNAMAALDIKGDTLQRFNYNHICRYTHTIGDVMEADDSLLRIKMLNGKYQNLTAINGNLVFGDIAAVNNTTGTSNGVLNTVGSIIPFYNNIYEEIKRDGQQTDSIAAYLKKRDHYTFLPDKSTVIGVNDRGETVYDSVFYFRNDWMEHYGDINLEDSVYTMLVPSDEAWNRQMEKLGTYFRTYGDGELRNPASGLNITGNFAVGDAKADSLARIHSQETLMQDLVFRKAVDVQYPDGDSLVSTNGNVFHSPYRLFAGARECGVSNGKMYVTDNLGFEPSESWHREIRVEAENSSDYATQYAGSTSTGSVVNYPQFAGQVSGNGFLVVNPTQLSFQKTTVRFRLPSTLSAKYNIYIVTVPASAVDTSLVNSDKLLSTRLKFYLRYVHEDGTLKEDAAIATPVDFNGTQSPTVIDSSKPAFITDSKNVSKMLVARNFRFPYANYTTSAFHTSTIDTPVTAFLRVETDVTTAAALAEFEKTMRIDCIILEPVD